MKNLDKNRPFTIVPFPNGGFVIEQAGLWPAPPGSSEKPTPHGAFSNREDMLNALAEALMPVEITSQDGKEWRRGSESTVPLGVPIIVRDNAGYKEWAYADQ